MLDEGLLQTFPLRHLVAAVSVGLVEGQRLLDLDYIEDSQAEVDMNVIQTDNGRLVEVQAAAEKLSFSKQELNQLLKLADKGLKEIMAAQRAILKKSTRSLLPIDCIEGQVPSDNRTLLIKSIAFKARLFSAPNLTYSKTYAVI